MMVRWRSVIYSLLRVARVTGAYIFSVSVSQSPPPLLRVHSSRGGSSAMSSSSGRWLPLESNPDMLNAFAARLGAPAGWAFGDVYGTDAELLGFVPRPVGAVVLLFPMTDNIRAAKEAQRARVEADKQPGLPAQGRCVRALRVAACKRCACQSDTFRSIGVDVGREGGRGRAQRREGLALRVGSVAFAFARGALLVGSACAAAPRRPPRTSCRGDAFGGDGAQCCVACAERVPVPPNLPPD